MSTAYQPDSLKEALRLRGETGAIPFAGGTDLMVRHKNWTGVPPAFPRDVLFLSPLRELQILERQGETLVVGAGVTFSRIAAFPETPEVLRRAVLSIAAPAIRNIATMTGNVCNASPAGDAICALYALEASVETRSIDSIRAVPIMQFITGPGHTILKKDELVTAIRIPLKPANIQVFRKVGTRKANALAKLSFAAVGTVKGGMIDALSLSFGAVGPTVVRSTELEKQMVGKTLAELKGIIPSLLNDYGATIVPIDDQRSTAAYRKQVALNLLESFLKKIGDREWGSFK
jgi:CO/xanthine dehydrogenase FAD-binding subunit